MMLWSSGQTLAMAEIELTLPSIGDAYVRLKAAALNKRDYWITKGKYPGLVFPLILGSDGAGIIGDREVIIDPSINWGDDNRHFGPGFKIIGMPDNGTLAEYVKVHEVNLYDKPSHLSWTEAAALPVAGVTAYRAMFTRGKAQKGERMLITGIGGGVATMSLLFGVASGIETWVTSSSDDKIEMAIRHGAKGGVNYKMDNWDKNLGQQVGQKFDIVIDGAGSPTFSKLLPLMNSSGRMVIYGGTAGNINELSPQRIFWKHLDILGSTMGSPDDFRRMVDLVNEYKIRPIISHTFSLAEANEAIALVGRGEQFGKVCISIP
ncbi:MAG: medium chain dehydrogenase/reductase family protein [Saprospiraceae bacterium]